MSKNDTWLPTIYLVYFNFYHLEVKSFLDVADKTEIQLCDTSPKVQVTEKEEVQFAVSPFL